jgi:hypothetical protein
VTVVKLYAHAFATKEERMVRVFVLYSDEPDQEEYAAHVDLARRETPGATTRHGRVFGSAQGESDVKYYFEYEFPDMDAFRQAGEGLMKGAEDAKTRGWSFRAYFAEIE